ncbi:MAG: NYN domain-containing protein [Candidatus Hodarchaeales archaeon]
MKQNKPNAVDFSLIQSCIDVMKTLPETTQIVLISGDGDFLPLISQLPNHSIVVICQRQNLNKKLIQTVNRAYSVEALITKTRKWFYVKSPKF